MSRFALLLILLLPATVLLAADPAFSTRLHAEEAADIGLAVLTSEETAALDGLVARDIAAARQGRVTGFRGTFVNRRTPGERTQAGLDRLTPAGQERLNQVVAAAIAVRNPPAPQLVAPPATSEGIEVLSALKPEVHGAVTLGYGWSEAGDYRFGSVETYYYDPKLGLTLGVGVSSAQGSGLTGRRSGRDCWRY